jgi:hypothetical protein
MSVTFSGGITFTGGGFSFTGGPEAAGWFAGGFNPSIGWLSSLQRITFANDTATASIRGQLSVTRYQLGAVSTTAYGWWGGGYAATTSIVDRTTFATDTAVNSVRGPLTTILTRQAASSDNTTYGWFGGGSLGNNGTRISTVTRITYANDTAVSTDRGPLSQNKRDLAATGNSTNGWFGGGYIYNQANIYYSTIDRITYATDTATASVRGFLSRNIGRLAATGTTTDGWFGGGYSNSPAPETLSTVQRITYATDTAGASIRGPLAVSLSVLTATGDTTYGWFAGGQSPTTSIVQRITYATDTNTASLRGPMALNTYNGGMNSACSGLS